MNYRFKEVLQYEVERLSMLSNTTGASSPSLMGYAKGRGERTLKLPGTKNARKHNPLLYFISLL